MKLRGRGTPLKRALSPSLTQNNQFDSNEKIHDSRSITSNSYRRKIALFAILAFVLFQIMDKVLHNEPFVSIRGNNEQLNPNPYALSAGELPGYTGWARPEQTLAGYFHIDSSSHSSNNGKYQSIVKSGDKFSLLITCKHDDNTTYACLSSGTLFYLRAYGPSVITGNVIDHSNSSYSIEFYPIDVGEYTVEVVVTFSAPLDLKDFPLNQNTSIINVEEEEEPGYEGYLISGFPISILVQSADSITQKQDNKNKQWCNLAQLTEQTPLSSLTSGHWQVIDHVGRSIHQPLTPDDALVSLDGYRMGVNSIGVRMQYELEDCELMHIHDIVGNANEGTDHVMERCLVHLGYDYKLVTAKNTTSSNILDNDNSFHGVDVLFVGDSVMKLEMGFFIKLLGGSNMVDGSRGINVTFIETNGGIQSTLSNIITTLNQMLTRREDNKRVILFNSGLHDIDILCSSKRRRTRNETTMSGTTRSCAKAYQYMMKQMIEFIDAYPADMKVFRTTTAGWSKYGNYGFTWPASVMQPQSRSTHFVYYFNQIAHDTIIKYSNSIHITDGYWITLPRPDHTQTSEQNQVGKHLIHPGYEVLSVFARRWLMLILWGLCEDVISQ